MTRWLCALLVLWPALASAQVLPLPTSQAPLFGLPAQQGGSSNPFTNVVFTGQSLGPDSCTAYSFTSAPTTGYGYNGTALCLNLAGSTILSVAAPTGASATSNYLNTTATIPNLSAQFFAWRLELTEASSGTQTSRGLSVAINPAAVSPNGTLVGGVFATASRTTGLAHGLAASATQTNANGVGTRIGLGGGADDGDVNFGVFGEAYDLGTYSYGVVGNSEGIGTNAAGGLFQIGVDWHSGLGTPPTAKAALIANTVGTDPMFIAMDDGVAVFSVNVTDVTTTLEAKAAGGFTITGAGGNLVKSGAGAFEIDSASGQSILLRPGGTATLTGTSASWTSTLPFAHPNGTAGAPSITGADATDGIFFAANEINWTVNGSQRGIFGATAINILSDTASFTLGGSVDTIATREAADHWFYRRSTNTQRASWANTYTSTTNYEAFSVDWQTTANVAIVGTRTAATGTGRPLRLVAQASNAGAMGYLQLSTTGGVSTSGTTPAVANVGANSCGTSAATIAGNDNSGIITVGATAGTQCRITFTTTAATRRECVANNETTANLLRTTYVSTTQTDVLGTMVAGDVLSYICLAR